MVLCDFSKLRSGKSPYDFLNLYGRFCPYNPPYNPGHDTLPSKMRIEIFTQRKKTQRKSIECTTLYRFTSRKPGLEISFRTQIWWQWVNKNDFPLMSERTVEGGTPRNSWLKNVGLIRPPGTRFLVFLINYCAINWTVNWLARKVTICVASCIEEW